MINTEIPKHYTASPSSYSGTPQLTINHGAVKDLDSSEAFEGLLSTEKYDRHLTDNEQGLRNC
jgi:hypothetical protein